MGRASWEIALRSGAQASAVLEQIAKLQTETLSRIVDEMLRSQKEMAALGNRVFAESTQALHQSLGEIASAIEARGSDAAEAPTTAEAGVRRREKAA